MRGSDSRGSWDAPSDPSLSIEREIQPLSRLWPGWRQALTMPGLAIRDGLNRSDRTEYAAFLTVRIGLGPSRATGRENLFWPSAEPHLCVIAAWLWLLGSEVLIRVYLKGIVRYPVPLSIREEHFPPGASRLR